MTSNSNSNSNSNSDELLAKVLRPGSSFYYSTLHLKQEDQKKLTIIFALFKEWLALHDNSREPQVAHTALHWWLEQVDLFGRCTPSEPAVNQSPHPLIQQLSFLHETDKLKSLVSERMKLIIITLLQDQHLHEHDSSLENFLRETWGNFCVICSFCIAKPHHDNIDTIDIQHQTGLLIGYHNILKNITGQLGAQRCALPQAWFSEWGFTPTELSAALQTHKENSTQHNAAQESPSQENSTQVNSHPKTVLLQKIRQVLHRHQLNLEALLSKPKKNDPTCLPALKAYTFETSLLQLTLKRDFEIYEYRLQLSPLKKLWLSWRCKRHYKARRFGRIFTKLKIN